MPSLRLSPPATPCPGAAARAQAWLDGALEPGEHAEALAHLSRCARCAGVHAAERRFRDFLAERAPRDAAPAGLRERVRLALRTATAARALAGRA